MKLKTKKQIELYMFWKSVKLETVSEQLARLFWFAKGPNTKDLEL